MISEGQPEGESELLQQRQQQLERKVWEGAKEGIAMSWTCHVVTCLQRTRGDFFLLPQLAATSRTLAKTESMAGQPGQFRVQTSGDCLSNLCKVQFN